MTTYHKTWSRKMGEQYTEMTHAIQFDPPLTDNQHKAVGMALEISSMTGALEECSNLIDALDTVAEAYAQSFKQSEEETDEHSAIFFSVIESLRLALRERGEAMFKAIQELDVNAS